MLSVAVGLVAVVVAGPEPIHSLGWVVYAAVVGVGIDVDHFLIAWYNTGTPRAIRYCVDNPKAMLFDQTAIFEPHELTKLERLLSHALIGGVLVAGLGAVSTTVATLTAVVLYVHIVADLVADVRDIRESDTSLR